MPQLRPWPLGALAMLGAAAVLLAGCAAAGSAGAPSAPAVADTAVLTTYNVGANHGPWELTWDAARGRIWFLEGNHVQAPLARVASIDPATSQMLEWSVPTSDGYLHGVSMDQSGNIWFSEVYGNKIGRLEPDSNTITEWTLPSVLDPHAVAVDDGNPADPVVWFSERDEGVVTEFHPVAGTYRRHHDPFGGAGPHGVIPAGDGSLWVVDTCDHGVGHLVPGTADQWSLWQPPTASGCSEGPLFGVLSAGRLWYTEQSQAHLLRLDPAANSFAVWNVPAQPHPALTQLGLAPDGTVFISDMSDVQVDRVEPDVAASPTIVAVSPQTASMPTPPAGQATPAEVVYTPIVTQLTPVVRNVPGTRTGGFTQWNLSLTVTPQRQYPGAARAAYGGGGFWVSEVQDNQVQRLAPFTPTGTPAPPTATTTPAPLTATATPAPPTATATSVPPTATPAPSQTPGGPTATPIPPSATATAAPPTATPGAPTETPAATETPCGLSFSDVHETDYFYQPVLYLACHGVISGYADGTFRPYSNTTRGQMVKIVVLGFGIPIVTPASGEHTFADVPPTFPFFDVIETAAAGQIVSGYACGGPNEPCDDHNRPYFRPYNDVTRGQLAKIVVIAAAWSPANPPDRTFADVLPGSAFYTYVETAVCHGIISGYTCGGVGEPCDSRNRPYFRQFNYSTRGQIAKIVYGALTGPAACAP